MHENLVERNLFTCNAPLPINMAHRTQSRPDSSLGFQVKVLKPLKVFPLVSEAVRGQGLSCALWRVGGRVQEFGVQVLGFRAPALDFSRPLLKKISKIVSSPSDIWNYRGSSPLRTR